MPPVPPVPPVSPASPVVLSHPTLMVSLCKKLLHPRLAPRGCLGGATHACAHVGVHLGVRSGAAWVAVAAVCVFVRAHGGVCAHTGCVYVCAWVCLCTRGGVCACHVALSGPSSLPPGEVSRAAGGGAGCACACKGVARVCLHRAVRLWLCTPVPLPPCTAAHRLHPCVHSPCTRACPHPATLRPGPQPTAIPKGFRLGGAAPSAPPSRAVGPLL